MLRRIAKWLNLGSPDRGDSTSATERSPDDLDALAATRQQDLGDPTQGEGGGLPLNYVKSYDEGRPRT